MFQSGAFQDGSLQDGGQGYFFNPWQEDGALKPQLYSFQRNAFEIGWYIKLPTDAFEASAFQISAFQEGEHPVAKPRSPYPTITALLADVYPLNYVIISPDVGVQDMLIDYDGTLYKHAGDRFYTKQEVN